MQGVVRPHLLLLLHLHLHLHLHHQHLDQVLTSFHFDYQPPCMIADYVIFDSNLDHFLFWTLIHFENCEESLIPIKLSFINLKPGGGAGATMEHGKGRGKIRIRPNRPLGFADFEFRLCQWVSSRYYKILQDTILTMTLIGLY